jgi:hypothetical protein
MKHILELDTEKNVRDTPKNMHLQEIGAVHVVAEVLSR